MTRFLRIEPSGYILGALCLYFLPFRWLMGAVMAASVHEIFHLLALRLSGVPVYALSLSGFGAKIETGLLEPGQQVFCALAGPLGSFFMLLLCRIFPEAALWGLVQGLFNLLPVYPMDGGLALESILPEKVFHWAEIITVLLLAGLSIWVPWLMLPMVLLAVGCRNRKFPCNATKKAVQ